MRIRLLFVALVVIGVVMAADDAPAPDDAKLLQGTWILVGFEVNGKSIGDAVRGVGIKVTFKDREVMFSGKGAGGKDGPLTGTFQLDPSKKPKTIDTTINKEVEPGIYQLEGDTLKLCTARAGGERPKEFKTGEGDGTRLFVFQRESKDKPVDKDKDKDKSVDKGKDKDK